MDDDEAQKDELLVLENIYLEEELSLNKDSDVRAGSFYCYHDLPSDFLVVCRNEEDCRTVEIPVSHLPPIALFFKYPKNYPSESPPEFTLSCRWLSPYKLNRLCKKLDSLWQENIGSVILYTWTEFLKFQALEFLKVDNRLEINIKSRANRSRDNKTINPPGGSDARRSPRYPTTRPTKPRLLRFDPRVISMPITASHIEQYLKAFNEDRCETIFLRSLYDCGICFECKKGSESIKFKQCGHIYCRQCICDYFKVRIKDGSVQEMPCPYDKCTSQATQKQVKEVVGTLLYNKYDSLLLTATLNSMDDITYCPRISCNSPVMTDGEEKLAMCPLCKHVFCTFCRMTYHGIAPCRVRTEEKMKLIEEYENGDKETRTKLEKRFGKKQFLAFIDEIKSEAWIEANSKPCPKCGAQIEKNDGCNKMSCKSCNSYFCWLCLNMLDKGTPYDHFFDENSPCQNKLFQGMQIPEEDLDDMAFDDEIEWDDDEDFAGFVWNEVVPMVDPDDYYAFVEFRREAAQRDGAV